MFVKVVDIFDDEHFVNTDKLVEFRKEKEHDFWDLYFESDVSISILDEERMKLVCLMEQEGVKIKR